tara:strand:+ start:704 stop:1078 length:375 start_codon:yes stop_codon:yes gene_type:complete
MTKRKPEKVVVHRIELQTKERELIESYLYLQQTNNLLQSLLAIDPKVMYMWLTILEGAGLIDTPIPTLSDAPTTDEVLNAIHTVFMNKPVVGGGRETNRGGFGFTDAIRFAITGEYPERMNPNR